MDPITVTLLTTAVVSIAVNILQAMKKTFTKIKCCFGGEAVFRDDLPQNEVPNVNNERNLPSGAPLNINISNNERNIKITEV